MPYIEDENGNHIFDENGDKIEFTVTYDNLPENQIQRIREPNTENRYI